MFNRFSRKSSAKKSYCFSKHYHPSISEADYCNWLLGRKQSREIRDFICQPVVRLTINGKWWRDWKVDFKVEELDGSFSYHENKGWNFSDESFRLKRDAFLICYPDTKLYVNKRPFILAMSERRMLKSIDERIERIKKINTR